MRPEERALSILLVEDHPFQLIGLEIELNRLGFYQLTPALDSAEAIVLISQGRRFDLLLCDQHLPDGYGIDLIEMAHAQAGIHFAMLISGIDDTLLRQQLLLDAQARGLPLLACLEKPLSATLFRQALYPVWHTI
jgi:CheY-like chemotaxis protein